MKRASVGVMYEQRKRRAERGYEDQIMEAVDVLPMVITEWSRGEVTEDAVRELSQADFITIWAAANGVDSPNPSTPSSDGTPTTKGKRRQSG